jgi:hypothetical protein
VGPVTVEVLLEVALDAREVAAQALPHLVCEVAARRPVRLAARVEQRAHACADVCRGRCDTWVEIEIQADRAAVLAPEAG